MPFALIPDGYSLKKVTKLQLKALNDKRRHDNVVTILNNPEIIKQIIVTGVAFLAIREGKDAFTKKRDVGAPVGVSLEDLFEEGLKRIPFL